MPTYEERIAQRKMLQRKAIADATAVPGSETATPCLTRWGLSGSTPAAIPAACLQVAATKRS